LASAGIVDRQFVGKPIVNRQSSIVNFAIAILALLFLAAHLPLLPSTLEDIDSVNFALGVRDFDIARHRPHPPGSPVFVAVAKGWTRVVAAAPAEASEPAVVRALALLAAFGGALAAVPLVVLFRRLESNDAAALMATLIVLASPLYFFNAARPMSDVVGLAAALVPMALAVAALHLQREGRRPDAVWNPAPSGRLIVLAAVTSGLAIGVRVQTAWLTLPLLTLVLLHRVGRGAAGALIGGTMTFTIGVLLWVVPLLVATGGLGPYVAALGGQAGEDIAGVDMLATNPTPRRLAFALLHAFVFPWNSAPLALVVLVFAALGAAAMLWRARAALAVLVVAFGPYAVFHLVFQETVTTRYVLPLLLPVAYLAARGVQAATRRLAPAAIMALAATSLAIAVPATLAYAASGSPLARALRDMEVRRLERGWPAGPVAMHHAFSRVLRDERRLPSALPAPPKHEWLSLVEYWKAGGNAPVWFLADPRRTDLALIDPSRRRIVQAFRWAVPAETFLGGVRPSDVDWVEIARPGWFLDRGWSLTPETAGVATLDGKGPSRGGVTAYVTRREGAALLMIGGRNLGRRGDPDVRFTASLDGHDLETWAQGADPGFFLRWISLPAGALGGSTGLATLRIRAEGVGGTGAVRSAIEQFDLQPEGSVLFGFDRGWHEMEYDPALGRRWRWSSDASVISIRSERDVTVRVRGESPLRYFDALPVVVLRAGARELGRFLPGGDFDESIHVPAAALTDAGGELTLTTSLSFVPDDRSGNGDRRRLGLRIYELTVR
jgi:hypothetical protein